jgi:S-DNA-T family DNA segregation ATPase FtsK/SpoIIIE
MPSSGDPADSAASAGAVAAASSRAAPSDVSTLIARAGAARVKRALQASPDEPVLFAVFDFDPAQTRLILEEIRRIEPAARIAIHPDLAGGQVPASWVSVEPLAHWRNVAREANERAIVSAVMTDDLDRLGETAATIYRVSPDKLRADVDAWFDVCRHFREQAPRDVEYLRRAIEGLQRTDIAVGITAFAGFMALLDQAVDQETAHKALNRALTALRIPPGAPNFQPPGERGRLTSPESWSSQLTDLFNRVSDVTYLRNDKGAPLDRAALRARLDALVAESEVTGEDAAKIGDLLDDADIEPGVWRGSQTEFVTVGWSVIQKVIRARKTTKQDRLGPATIAFIDREFASALTNVDRDVLERLEEARPADPEEKALFSRYASRIERDRKLLRRWEQFVFREVRTHTDLQTGILRSAFELLGSAGGAGPDQVLLYRLSKANELDFWRRHLLEASTCLRDRYRGLRARLPGFIRIDCGICWSRDWFDEIDAVESHAGREAEYKFEVFLLRSSDLTADGEVDPAKLDHAIKTQMIWTPTIRGLGANFAEHIRAATPDGARDVQLLIGRYSRTAKDTASGTTALKLADRRTISDVNDGDEGQLFDPNDPQANIAKTFNEQLKLLEDRRVVSPERRERIASTFGAFADAYERALRAFREPGGAGARDPALLEQGRAYGALLETLRADAPSDACRRALWAPAMQLGIALSRNLPGAIVTPLNPFRLAELGLKAALTVEALETIKANPDDPGLRGYTDRIEADLQRSWFSDFMVLPRHDGAFVAMTESQFLDGYSYVEPLAHIGAGDEQGAYTRQAADNLMKVLSEHLDLHPHNATNLSVVLYNSESRDLPSAVAERLARRVDEDERLRCDLIIASDDLKRLRQIYGEQNVAIGRELETSGGADLTKEFLSNLRVGIGDAEQLATSDSDHKPLDVAFLQDVFARNARLRWRHCANRDGGWPDIDLTTRAASSRRQVHGPGENKTRILLVSPSRPGAIQAYLDLAMELADSGIEDEGRRDRWEPIREITFDNDENARVIDRAHRIADWVVTFDEIADRRLFRQNQISVIRSVPIDEVRHNLVVSTSAYRRSLAKRIAEMLSDVTSRIASEEITLARELINRAADISGQIVLRAANRDTSALELIGLSLSEHMIRSSMPVGAVPLAWFFLDDFKTRFGHLPSDEVADILLVTALDMDGAPKVALTVIEAKCVSLDSASRAREKSRSQTVSTLERLSGRYGSKRDELNAAAYAAQLADLLVEHGTYDQGESSERLASWIEAIRDGNVEITAEGVSLVFVHDDLEAPEPPRFDDAFRQVSYARPGMAQILEDIRAGRRSAALPTPPADGSSGGPPPPTNSGSNEPAPDTPPSPLSRTRLEAAAPALADAAEPLSEAESDEAQPPPPPSAPSGTFRPGVAAMIASRPLATVEVEGQAWLQTAANRLKAALKGYGLTCDVVGARLTPNSALIRFRGNESMTVEAVNRRVPTLLTSHALEVVAVRPAKGEVVVMVARDHRVILPTLDLWARRQLSETAPLRNTSFVLGEREDTGEILYLNLGGPFAGQPQHGPHTLIAGETGGGKGVFAANLLLDICATNAPSEARIWLVDPKAGIDYSWIEHAPHLEGPILTTPDDAMGALKALVVEMERRYADVLAPTKSPNLDAYNARVEIGERLPRIYFFHDELADWMADKSDTRYRDAVSDYVVRLSGKARAAGIHLFLITQRPDKDALPGLIKANMNNKIALKVANRLNSQIILDEPGAESLLGHGHMIAKLANQPGGLIYAQAPYLSPEEAAAVAEAIAQD